MKSNQVLSAAKRVVSALLTLRWRRISNSNKRVWVEDTIQAQTFHFFKKNGVIACAEFTEMKFNDGLGWIESRKGKLSDATGNVILASEELYDYISYSNYKPKEHPLNDLYDILWNKGSGGPISQEGKFPETIKLEQFIETLRA